MNTVICETRFCPGCGMEIRCESEDGELIYYFVQDRPMAGCPQCGLEFAYDNLEPVSAKQKIPENKSGRSSISKAGLISEIKEKNARLQTKADAERVLNSVAQVLIDNLTRGKDIIWSDLGRFKIVARKARKGRHPRSGAEITIPERLTVRFNPGKKLKGALNEKKAV